MKKYPLILLLLALSLHLQAQRIQFDIFGDLQYASQDQRYTATLKKDIFGALIFSDNSNNTVTFNKEYLDLKFKGLLQDEEAKRDFFKSLIGENKVKKGYQASHVVDIFGNVVFQDNRNNKIEIGKDIFGNSTYEEKRSGVHISMKKDAFGNLEYTTNKEKAYLKKDIFNKWNYTDSSGNKFEFGAKAWARLTYLYSTEEDIFFYLINEFLPKA
ncbi:hypothetical protein [Rufibacter soli]